MLTHTKKFVDFPIHALCHFLVKYNSGVGSNRGQRHWHVASVFFDNVRS